MKPAAGRRLGASATLALALGLSLAPRAFAQSMDDRYGIVVSPTTSAATNTAAAPSISPPDAGSPTAPADSQVLLSYDRNNSPAASAVNPLRDPPPGPPTEPVPTAPPLAAASSSLSAAAPFDPAETPLAAAPPAVEAQSAPTFPPGGVEPAAFAVELPPDAALDSSAEPPPAPADAPAKEAAASAAAPITSDSLLGHDEVESKSRRLSPPSSGAALRESPGVASRAASMLPAALSNMESLSTAGVGLAVVIGLLVLCTWGLRRGGPKRGGSLPDEAFAVLGRAPLAAQSFAQLLRVGNKLVLVAITPQGAQALAEVTDPMEVGRLIGLCGNGAGHGPSAEFQQVLAQLAREPVRGFLEKETHGGRRA